MNELSRSLINSKFEIDRLIHILREMARNALPNEELPKKIYHYTDLDGLKGILETETIYFSAMHMLNDASEVSYMWDFLQKNRLSISMEAKTSEYQKFIDGFYEYGTREELCKDFFVHKRMPEFLNIFSASFSKNGDSLPLWNGYSGNENKGFNLAFSENELRDSFSEKLKKLANGTPKFLEALKEENMSIENYASRFFYGSIIYENEEQVKALKILFLHFWKFYQDKRNKIRYEAGQRIGILGDLDYESFVYLHLFQGLTILMVFIKDPHFQCEEEYRIAFFDYENIPGEKEIPKFIDRKCRSNRGSDIPYVAIPYDKNLIQKVTISPPNKDAERQELVENILLSNHIHAAVAFSEIPLR